MMQWFWGEVGSGMWWVCKGRVVYKVECMIGGVFFFFFFLLW
jgi:hypothetical protein